MLEDDEWFALVEKVAGGASLGEWQAVRYAATKLREHFASELWEAAKNAWKKNDLAWPALNLRLLGLILGHVGGAAGRVDGLREEIAALRDAVGRAAAGAEKTAPDLHKEMLKAAIREYQDDLSSKLDQYFQRVFKELAELKAALANPRVAPVKERWINLPNTSKQILARDGEAEELLKALRTGGPGIVSIAAPPGFGKTAVFALALRMALSNGDPPEAEVNGIAVLDAKAGAPGIAGFAHLLGRITGLQEAAARFASAAAEHPDANLRDLFFDFLRQAGRVWLVVENAEGVLASAAPAGRAMDFRGLLKAWCQADHQAKLLLLTRNAPQAAPDCHRGLRDVEKALLGGLPEDAALELLRQRLEDTRFRQTGEPLLRQIVQRLHRVPMALEQFAGYLRWNEQGVELNQRFLDQNDLLKLHASEQMEDFLLRLIGENLKLLDAPSLDLLRVVAWAGMPVPHSGVVALQPEGGSLLTRLVRSNQLLAYEGTAAEGRSFDLHPLIREALAEPPAALDFGRVARVVMEAGTAEWKQGQFRPALALYTLAERAARIAGEREELAGAIMNRGAALDDLGRLEEAVAAYDESIAIRRELVEKEHRQELRNGVARAIMNRGVALWNLGRLEEAVAAYDQSIVIYRVLVEKEHRQELRNELARAIMNRGIALRKLGRFDQTVAAYDESIVIWRVLVETEHRQELRNDLARALYNLALAREKQNAGTAALAAAREARQLWEDLVNEGAKHLERDLVDAKNLEARLSQR